MAILNYTEHPVVILDEKNEKICEIPSQGVARVSVSRQKLTEILFEKDGESIVIPVNQNIFGEVEGLPEENGRDLFIVSMLTAKALPNREDLITPDEVVRSEDKRIILGCKAFCRP